MSLTILKEKELINLDELLGKLQNSAGQGKVTRTKNMINTFGLAELHIILKHVNYEIDKKKGV